MTFEKLVSLIQAQFNKMCATGKLFRVYPKLDSKFNSELWKLYLSSFKEHRIWREVSEHDCVEDRSFFERYANIVAIENNKIITLFDIEADLGEYTESVNAVAQTIRANANVFVKFFETYNDLKAMGRESDRVGLNENQATYTIGYKPITHTYLYDSTKTPISSIANYDKKYDAKGLPKMTYTYSSFCLELPKEYVDFSGKSAGELQNEFTSNLTAFTKAMNNISPLALEEFINKYDLKLYMFDEYANAFDKFLELSNEFVAVPNNEATLWLVNKTIELGHFAKWFSGNEGELYTAYQNKEYSSEEAFVIAWNKRQNEKYGSNKPVTEAQKAEAQKVLEELGYIGSLQRRFATPQDIDVSQIRFSGKTSNVFKPVNMFALAGIPKTESSSGTVNEADFENVPKISIRDFYNLLPNLNSVELLVANRFSQNFTTLLTEVNPNSKPLFAWNNPFSITYNGNRARKSIIAEKVKAAGGLTEGDSLCRLNWNQEGLKGTDNSDLDLHCKISNGDHIYFGSKFGTKNSGGVLDIDIQRPKTHSATNYEGIENIAFKNLTVKGSYTYSVHNFYDDRSKGFVVELQIFNELFSYSYTKPVRNKEEIKIVTVNYLEEGKYTIVHHLPFSESSVLQEVSQTIWGIETNKFHKVSLSCYSPNHWGEDNSKSLEYLFFLEGCKPDTKIKTFHVDHLNTNLMSKPVRRALNLYADYSTVTADKDTNVLAGLGFNSTISDSIVAKVVENGKTRVFKIQF